jgi:hypothetical protein
VMLVCIDIYYVLFTCVCICIVLWSADGPDPERIYGEIMNSDDLVVVKEKDLQTDPGKEVMLVYVCVYVCRYDDLAVVKEKDL